MTTSAGESREFVLCLSNDGYHASLMVRRLYELLPDPEAVKRGLLRVIDESGEDYLFPSDLFAALDLPVAVRERLTT